MSILESYALGKPVIGASIGGIPELIRAGDTGFLFPSGDVAALAELMRRVCDMPDAAVADLGRNGRRWVEDAFSSRSYTERVLNSYRELGVAASGAAA
jgi:glycosyltransferase involved in cell wall biosynthesis